MVEKERILMLYKKFVLVVVVVAIFAGSTASATMFVSEAKLNSEGEHATLSIPSFNILLNVLLFKGGGGFFVCGDYSPDSTIGFDLMEKTDIQFSTSGDSQSWSMTSITHFRNISKPSDYERTGQVVNMRVEDENLLVCSDIVDLFRSPSDPQNPILIKRENETLPTYFGGLVKEVFVRVEVTQEDMYVKVNASGISTPEPASIALLGLGGLALMRRKNK